MRRYDAWALSSRGRYSSCDSQNRRKRWLNVDLARGKRIIS